MTRVSVKAHHTRYDGFEVAWAGGNPSRDSFYFGSEDGALIPVRVEGMVPRGGIQATKSGEAINGVAFTGPHLAVSTRADLNLFMYPMTPQQSFGVIPIGAHGVIATTAGQFIAPLGRNGLMVVTPGENGIQELIKPLDDLYFYRVASLESHPDVVVCGARQGGIVVMTVARIENSRVATSNNWVFPGLDVVDVCSLDWGRSAAAVSNDCTMFLFHDVDRHPITLGPAPFEERAYRLMEAGGSIYLLTSAALYVFPGLARNFLDGKPVDRLRTQYRRIPMEAVDANVSHGRWLLVVTTDGVSVFDTRLLAPDQIAGPTEDVQEIEFKHIEPRWENRPRETAVEAFAQAVA